MKKIDIKKWIMLGVLLLPMVSFAEGLDEGIDMIASTGTLFGIIIVVIAVALWMMPIALAGLVYTGQKKKAEQMHEEVGLKAAILALLAGVLGVAMSFYIVGTIGLYSAPSSASANTLTAGNGYLMKKVVDPGIRVLSGTASNTTLAGTGLNDGITMVASIAKLFGILIVVVSVSLWLLPIAFAGLVYTGQKKKAEQMHEEVGLKAAIVSLLAGILGAAMAFYVVGTIGYLSKTGSTASTISLKEGNRYLMQAIVGSGADKISPDGADGANGAADGADGK